MPTSDCAAERQQTIHVSAEHMQELITDHLMTLGQSLRLPRFSPGHIPLPVLEEHHGPSARTKVVENFIIETASALPEGALVTHVDIKGDSDATLELTILNIRELPDPDVAGLTLDRLTGLEAGAQQGYLKEQVLDYLDNTYRFRPPARLVERDFMSLARSAQSGEDTPEIAAEIHVSAERRVRLGMMVVELARRYGIDGAGIESQVLGRLMEGVKINERPATADEIRDLS
jgi:FKBP-type peptidyl-prolyl cis-trans isomerase (trigger factor)